MITAYNQISFDGRCFPDTGFGSWRDKGQFHCRLNIDFNAVLRLLPALGPGHDLETVKPWFEAGGFEGNRVAARV